MAAAPPPGLSYFCGARRGWLVLSDDLGLPTRLVLWEPLSGTEIPLPRLRLWPVTQVLISGDPLASSHWMAVAIQRIRADTYALFFWRPGDAAWSDPSGAIPAFAIPSVEFHAGIMYCNTDTSNIFIYNLNLGTSSAPALLQVSELSANEFIHSRRVVACGGQILIVLLFGWPHPSHAEIYMPLTTPRWPFQIGDRVTDLAGYSLFLGDGDAFALPANEFPAIKGSRIHCLKDKVLGLVFDLKTDAVEEIPQLREEDGSISWLPYSWFCPRRPFLED
uniref:Uncharacterized protein n=1 Tax=Avena sativa TaxID=4498 RepID=A0ACD5TIR3_AVESA